MSIAARPSSIFAVVSMALASVLGACAAGQGSDGELTPCFVDGDCPGSAVCSSGLCVAEGSDEDGTDGQGGLSEGSDGSSDESESAGADTSDIPDDSGGDPTGASEPLDTDGAETDGGVCIEADEPCEASADCCGYEETPVSGSAACIVDPQDNVACTNWCETHDDCASTCCAGVADQELGACIPGSVCRAYDRCLDGVVLFCQCGVLAESECTDEEIDAYVAECGALEGGAYDIFDCLGGHYTGSTDPDELLGICVDGLDMCNPE